MNATKFITGQKLNTTSEMVYLTRIEARQSLDHCAGPILRDARAHMLLTTTVDGHQVAWVMGTGGARAGHVGRELDPFARRIC